MPGAVNVALVTGASSGIGLEFARLLAEEGRDLVVVGRSTDRLRSSAEQIRSDYRVTVHDVTLDLSDDDAIERLDRFVAEHGLHVNLLVNNAGVGLLGRFEETALDEQLHLVQLNVRALVELTHRLLPSMVEKGSGGIINVGSMASFTPGPLMSTYYASKAFVLSFSEALARELKGTGVSVTALCPGPVETRFQARAGFPGRSSRTLPAVDARTVAQAGLRGLAKGKSVVIPGFANKVMAAMSRVLPSRLTSEAVFKVQRSRMEDQE